MFKTKTGGKTMSFLIELNKYYKNSCVTNNHESSITRPFYHFKKNAIFVDPNNPLPKHLETMIDDLVNKLCKSDKFMDFLYKGVFSDELKAYHGYDNDYVFENLMLAIIDRTHCGQYYTRITQGIDKNGNPYIDVIPNKSISKPLLSLCVFLPCPNNHYITMDFSTKSM